jgi:2-keto-4-pentenoate hydratase
MENTTKLKSPNKTRGELVKLAESSEIVSWGRRIHGPTLPGRGIHCKRTAPLTASEINEIIEIIARARIEHRSGIFPDRLKTRDWESVLAVIDGVNEKLKLPYAGWKVGAASEEIRRAEGVPGPCPGQISRKGVYESPARLPSSLFINYRCSECEFAFRMATDMPSRDIPYNESEVGDAVEALFPAIEIGDTVFEDWYGASGYHGCSMDNGGAAAFVYGAPIQNWREMDLANAKIELYLNGRYMKSGYGRAAMGNPITSLTWMVNWLRARGKILRAGDFVSTGTCTGHFFATSGDWLEADFGKIGQVAVTYE